MFVRIASLFFVCFFAQMVVAQTASFAPSASALLPGQLPRLTRSGGVIYRCLFDSASDALDSDSWPDYWSRKTGIEQGIQFPEYLDIALVQRDSPFSGGALRMDIRGGAAAVFSPKIPVRAGMSYTISVYFLAEKLVHSNVSLIVSFYGSEGAAPLKSVMSPAEKNTRGWRKIAVGPLHADVLDVQAISVGLLVLPKERNDFEGLVEWTNLEIRESPTIELQTPVENNIFSDVSQVTIDCRVTGIDPAQHTVLFSLEDAQGRVIATKETDVLIGNRPASQIVIAGDKPENVYVASAKWEKLPLVSPGFYRVRMATPKAFIQSLPPNPDQFFEDPFTHTKPITLAVLASAAASSAHFLPNGEFGWSLDGWSHEQIQSQVNLLRKSGISRLKLPVWFEENATAQDRDRFSELCEVLAQQNLDLVGLLTPIPKSVRDQIRYVSPDARAVFSLEPRVWSDGLQQTLQDLSLLIQDWQWTADDDVSLQNVPNFEANFDSWKAAFDRQEFGLGIGLAWDWNAELPRQFAQQMPSQSANTPENPATRDDRDFVALTSANPLTPDEMGAFLAGSAESGNMVSANSASDNPVTSLRRFVTLSPLSRNDYELEERIRDFVRRMVIAKASGVEAIFLEKPIDEDRGVLLSDLTPTELFLPWRTTANMLSGRNFLGSVDMPQGSRNFCFEADGGKAVMVLWNDEATEETAMGGGPVLETLFLGEKVEGQDVWGKTFIPELQGHEQVIPVGTLPIFVTGLDANIVRFRASFELGSPPPESGDLGNKKLPALSSLPNIVRTMPFSFKNNFDTPITVQLIPQSPRPGEWLFTPRPPALPITVPVGPGETASGEFSLSLSPNALYDRQPFTIHVQIDGAERLEFDVYKEIFIGDPDVFLEISSRLTPNGDIEVTQALVNNSEVAHSFDFRLYAPRRPYVHAFEIDRGFGRWETVYTIPNGVELIQAGVTEALLRGRSVGSPEAGTQPMVYSVPLPSSP